MNYRNSIFKFAGLAMFAAMVSCTVDDAFDVPHVELGAPQKEYVVEPDENSFDIQIYTSSNDYHIERLNECDWLKLTEGELVDGMVTIAAECEMNPEFKRKASIVLCSNLDGRRDTLYVKQKAYEDAMITFPDASVMVPGAGGEYKSEITSNIPFEDITIDIVYSDENKVDWITGIDIPDTDDTEREIHIFTDKNPDEVAPRTAAVTLSFTDGWEETVQVRFNLLQRTALEAVGEKITFADFRNKYARDGVIDDYILLEGFVVSNPDNLNAGECTQETTATIDYTVSEKTVYFESVDGQYGISLITSSAAENIFKQYDRVELLVQGAKVKYYEDPERYELTGVTSAMITSQVAGTKGSIPRKEKYFNQITDADIFTYVTLKDVEIPVRKGALTPLNEGYAIGTGVHRISKYPRLIRDINGDATYMIHNAKCAYRSDGTRLPYGSGNISGVIVHERFSRFEWRNGADPLEMEEDPTLGYIGRYQIRPQVKGDVWDEMNDSVEDSFSALLCEYRWWNPDKDLKAQKPSYGTNGWFDHTYQSKYTGSTAKEYLQATYQQHMWGGGTYAYLGPVGNSANYYFGANYGNKNGIGAVIDLTKESWNSGMDDLISRNPDGSVEWCGQYATNQYAASGVGGWPGNSAIPETSQQINYSGSTSMRGKANVSGNCYTSFASHYWWDDNSDRFYSWLLNFSTEGINTNHISLQISVMNTQQTFYSPRFWAAEWSFTDSQSPADDDQWHLIGEYTIPDVSVWANTLYSSIVAYKHINFELPLEILGHENVYIRLHPTSDLCSDGSEYANARLRDSASSAAEAAEHSSNVEYIAIRYNK